MIDMADLPATVIKALGELLQVIANLVKEKPPDLAHRLRRAALALAAERATNEAARQALRKRR